MPDTVRKAARMAGLIAVRKNDGDSSGIGSRQWRWRGIGSDGAAKRRGGIATVISLYFFWSPIKLCRLIALLLQLGERESNDAMRLFVVFLRQISYVRLCLRKSMKKERKKRRRRLCCFCGSKRVFVWRKQLSRTESTANLLLRELLPPFVSFSSFRPLICPLCKNRRMHARARLLAKGYRTVPFAVPQSSRVNQKSRLHQRFCCLN